MIHLKVPVKWNYWWQFTYVCTISVNFENYFLKFLWEIVFGVISGNYLYLWLLENAKRILIHLIILVQDFWLLKTETARFVNGSLLNSLTSWSVLEPLKAAWHSPLTVCKQNHLERTNNKNTIPLHRECPVVPDVRLARPVPGETK